MAIDRSNYEIWLIDWLDGNLTDIQIEQLREFLAENPELVEEFEELSLFSLKPTSKSFPLKDNLKKKNTDLFGSQFEYICVANLEDDLSGDQKDDLRDIIENDSEKKSTFDFIQKITLTPSDIRYRHKHKLIKRTLGQKVIRLSAIGLSAAAVVTLIIMSYSIIPRIIPEKMNNAAQNIIFNDSSIINSPANLDAKIVPTDNNVSPTIQTAENIVTVIQEDNSVITRPDLPVSHTYDSLLINAKINETEINKIPVYSEIKLKEETISNTLIASRAVFIPPVYEDERNRFSKFITKTFREKILRESPSENNPLKAYEIAEAGVTGINKLFGWEMGLDKRNDENGELKSIYFSSRILKFNAPVKKTEPRP